MTNQQSGQEIDDAAAHWAAKVDGGQMTAAEETTLQAWLDQDVRHNGAYAKARAICMLTERARALGPGFEPQVFADLQAPTPWRRQMLWVSSVAAAVCVAIAAGLTLNTGGKHFSTRLGETLIVPLQDGSVVTLNTASRVNVSYTQTQRNVELIAGEALFEVAKDPQHPFSVNAGNTRVRAIGTSFTVARLSGQPVQVLVREGVIEVKEAGQESSAVRVVANSRVTARDDARIDTYAVAPTEVTRELSWRDGRIAFEGETLQEAADTFARYSNTRIVIRDPQLAAETITGLFVSNDAVGFAKAVALSLNLHVQVKADEVQLSR